MSDGAAEADGGVTEPFPRLEVSHYPHTVDGEDNVNHDEEGETSPKRRRISSGRGLAVPQNAIAASPRMSQTEDGQQSPGLMVPGTFSGVDSRRSSITSLIPPLRKLKGTPKEKFRTVALVIRIFQKLIRTTFRKPSNICDTCKRLQLSRDKFIIEDNSFDRNQQAYRSHHSLRSRSRSNLPLGSGSGRIPLGSYSEIRRRSIQPTKCPFCYLVVCSLKDYPGLRDAVGDDDALQCDVSWTVDGREIVRGLEGSRVCNRTRRIRLHWSAPDIPDAYLILVAPEALYSFGPSEQAWDLDSLFLGRYIKTAAKNTALIRGWLNLCDENHGKACHNRRSERFERMIAQSYFGVVDVHEMRLTPLPANAKYVALSYVWGKGYRYQTLLRNVQEHSQPGGLEKVGNHFPRVIADSLGLVRALGERYLWVDSLCIVQDSPEAWALNSANMDVVYGNADFTICAADGANAKDPLKAISPKDRKIKQYMELCAEDLTLMVSHPAETYVTRSDWNTRAWTFQERLLSRRCLLFAEGRVFFQCRSTAISEDVVSEKESACWSIELVQAPLQLLKDLECRAFRVYMESVGLYTERTLTRPKDILSAFNGLSNLLGNAMDSPLIFGLPSSHFDLALLWQPAASLRRRVPRNDDERKDFEGAVFPSWSWCGWMRDEAASRRSPKLLYNESMLAGVLSNVHQWLIEHTWISWYIRDRHGNLRPIWSADSCAKPQNKIEMRWRGYGFPNPLALKESEAALCDKWGRQQIDDMRDRERDTFRRTLPHYPFRVSFAQSSAEGIATEGDKVYLQFWTWSAVLRIYPTSGPTSRVGDGLRRYDITDYTGDWCGTVVVDEAWEKALKIEPGREFEFLAISEAKNFSAEENDTWTYYIPKEQAQSEWDLFYVMLVEHDRGIGHRVGLGKVFQEAFSNSCLPGKEWKEFILE